MFLWELLLLIVFSTGFIALFLLYGSTIYREDPLECCQRLYLEAKYEEDWSKRAIANRRYMAKIHELYGYVASTGIDIDEFKRSIENHTLSTSAAVMIKNAQRNDYSETQIKKGIVVTLVITLLSFTILGCGIRFGMLGA